MYRRRRRRTREIAFSLDSFLDVITNVIGIIIRMILVVSVGARAYHEVQSRLELAALNPAPAESAPASANEEPSPQPQDPLANELARRRLELEKAQEELLAHLRQLPELEKKEQLTQQQLAALAAQRQALEQSREGLQQAIGAQEGVAAGAQVSLAGLADRSDKLRKEIARLNELPVPKKTIQYRTPVSRPVTQEELYFECQNGRVTFVDFTTLQQEMRDDLENRKKQIFEQGGLEGVTGQVGAFRLRYAATVLPGEAFSGKRQATASGTFEPAVAQRGETLAQALQPRSEFRQIVDFADPKQTVITFWVYPDSFPLYRQLRDYLYQRDLEVAARPMPTGQAIGFSPQGSASRSQ